MAIVDFILNLAGLLLWIKWRSLPFDPIHKRTPATLVGTLRRAAPSHFRRWHLLAAIGGLLVLRAVFYWQIGPAAHWTGKLDLGVITLSFRSDLFGRMLLFSFFSFGLTLGIFYLWLLLLSLLAGSPANAGPIHRLVRMPLGGIDGWPRWAKIISPFVGTALLWWLASWLFAWLEIIPQAGFRRAPHRGIAGHRPRQLSGLEIGRRRAARAASAEHLHLFRQTSVLELCERDRANVCCAVAENSVARGQGGFRAGRGNRHRLFCGRTGGTRTGLALRAAAVLKTVSPFSPWAV